MMQRFSSGFLTQPFFMGTLLFNFAIAIQIYAYFSHPDALYSVIHIFVTLSAVTNKVDLRVILLC
uniref:Uncharacterized protein n=1 Tax=Arundo donax TaxID=35708 RepID=A0A0A9BGV0_ARUDO